jgi:hypothetical protein
VAGSEAEFLPPDDDGDGGVFAVVVLVDVDGVAVLFGCRFPVGAVQGADAEGFALVVVAGGFNDGDPVLFEFGGESGESGGAVALVAQLLGNVQEHVRFVHDDRFEYGGRFLV